MLSGSLETQVVDGRDSLWIWMVATNILNKQTAADKSGPPAWRFGGGLKAPHHKKLAPYKMLYR
jgi:hypothetical protein